MRRTFAVLAAAVLGLLASAGPASASDPGGSAEQAAASAAAGAQAALALAGALQRDPSNANIAVRVLSPGDAGSVSQSNTVIAGSVAANGNSTSQVANQTQSPQTQAGSGTQTAGQIAGNEQAATGAAGAAQLGAANENIDVRVLSPGDGGSVSQSNTVIAGSLAGNGNETAQAANQSQAGGTGSGPQTSGQAVSSKQDAAAGASAAQHGARNQNISVRVLSPGDDGSVEQSNTVAGIAAALNGNSTAQSATQGSAAHPGGSATQAVLQGATSRQGAAGSADAQQKGASNENVGVRVLSPGHGGSVSQSNTVLGASLAKNENATTQSASQSAAGGHASGTQVVGQLAANHQAARADSDAHQYGASNTNVPVRIGSHGDDGAVSQSNAALGLAAALNGNETTQSASQTQTGGAAPPVMPLSSPDKSYPDKQAGAGVQAIGQAAESTQVAGATSDAVQAGAGNLNAPVSIGGHGDSGSVSQANTTAAIGAALNANRATQAAGQSQAGSGGSPLVQALGQVAENEQAAAGTANAVQKGATNTSTPLRLGGRLEGKCGSRLQACEGRKSLEPSPCQSRRPHDDRCETGTPDDNGCGSRQAACEWKKPLEPSPCEPRRPGYDRCEPRQPDCEPCEPCGRLEHNHPDRKSLHAS